MGSRDLPPRNVLKIHALRLDLMLLKHKIAMLRTGSETSVVSEIAKRGLRIRVVLVFKSLYVTRPAKINHVSA